MTVVSATDEGVIARAIALVQGGQLVVIPTDTSYAVIADAFHMGAITKLRIAKKQTSDVSLPIAAGSIDTIRGVALLSELASDIAQAFWPGALTILTAPQPSLAWSIGASDSALAVRVPNHELARQILTGIGPTVMTGAQHAGAAPITTVELAQAALGDAVSLYVDGGELSGATSSVLDTTGAHPRLLREGALSLAALREIAPMVVKATG